MTVSRDPEVRELVELEVKRHLSPKALYSLIALVVFLLIWVFLLEMRIATQNQWIIGMSADIKALRSAAQMTDTLEEISGAIKRIEERAANGQGRESGSTGELGN